MSLIFAAVLPVFAVLGSGCTPDPTKGLSSTAPPEQVLDYNQFVCAVQPILIRRCSYLGCHGNPAHALRVYSPGKLRQGDIATRAQRDGTLTADEVGLNFQSAVGLVYAATPEERQRPAIDRVPLLWKPLRAAFGGGEHHGVGIFPVYPLQTLDKDAEWQALVAWVGGAQAAMPLDADCADLFSALNLQPRM